MWIWLSLASVVGWSFGSIFLKPAYKVLSSPAIYFLNGIFFLLFWVFYAGITGFDFNVSNKAFLLLPVLPPIAFITFLFAIKKGKVSMASAVSSTSPFVSTSLAWLFLGERINALQMIMIGTGVIILATLWLIEKNNRYQNIREINKLEGFYWGLVAAISFGVANTASKFVIDQTGIVNFSIVNGLWMIFLGFIWLVLSGNIKKWSGLKTKEGRSGLVGAIIYSLGSFLFFYALQRGLVSLVIPVTNMTAPLTLILATIFLKERITPAQRFLIGLVFVTTTILIIS